MFRRLRLFFSASAYSTSKGIFALLLCLVSALPPALSQNNNPAFTKALAFADSVFSLGELDNALAAYRYANRLNPQHELSKKRIADIQLQLENNEGEQKAFIDLIAQAKKALYDDDFMLAKEKLTDALKLQPKDAFALQKLEEINQNIKDQAEKESEFEKMMQDGDASLAQEDFDGARTHFREAEALFPERKDPIARIALVDAAEQKKKDAFENLLSQADALYREDRIAEALPLYEEALTVFPDDARPQQKIHQIKMILAYEIEDQKKYDVLIAEADEFFGKKDLNAALNKYQMASDLKKKEEYPKNQIITINAALEAAAKIDDDYSDALAKAAGFESSEDWQSALDTYLLASDLKPKETLPHEKIKELSSILEEIAQLNKNYAETIAQADKLFEEENWTEAKSSYQNALTIKPEESYPQTQIAAIDLKIKELADADAAYAETIAQADKLFEEENWTEAKTSYQNALTIKPEESYPQTQIAAIDLKIKELADVDAAYTETIAQADKLFKEENWTEAKSSYQNALTIKPEESYPQAQIAAIDLKIKELADVDAAYAETIAQADKLFKEENWTEAKSSYQNALTIKPEESYPQAQIAAIDLKIKELADVDAAYAETIAQADKLFEEGNWIEAKSSYQNALTIKPEESYPQAQIAAIDLKIKELADVDAAYTETIAQADKLFEEENWTEAKTSYQNALTIKPEESYPQAQIAAIDLKIKELADANAAYTETIAQADKLFEEENWTEAKSSYQNALTIKPEESYPQTQIAAIDLKIKELADADAAYTETIAQADKLFEEENWTEAKSSYQNALTIKAEESYPQTQIAAIDLKIKELADANAAYAETIAQADKLFEEENWTEAKTSYQNALTIKAEESYPQTQIAAIDLKIKELADADAAYAETIAQADKLFEEGNWTEAKSSYQNALTIKPEESYPQAQIAAIDLKIKELADVDAAYAETIAQADKLFEEENWTEAKTSYQNALTIKPEESYPQTQIAAIDLKIKELADANAAYAETIAQADKLFEEENWTEAKTSYQNALTIKAEESYPQTQIAAIDLKIKELADVDAAYAETIAQADKLFEEENWTEAKSSYQNALTIKPEESYPQTQIAAIDLKIKELADADAAYTETIAQADKLFKEENWTEAKTSYQNALTIKAEESYPQAQIAAIDLKIKELADADAAYTETIAQADKLFEEENWTEAKSSYQNALTIKAEESYPQAQIAAIDLKIKELEDADAAYTETIAQADKLFEEENWTEAKSSYQNALTIKPEESYPQAQIAAIDLKIKELADADAAYAETIAQADKLFKEENWTEAKSSYQNALTIKPEESYPQTQIAAIDLKIKELADVDAAYTETIAQADKLFEEENWTEAKSSYQNALTIKPEESYPQTQIAAIDLKIKELADADAAYTETIAQADKLFEEENWTEAKTSYQNALTIKPEESYPQTQIAAIDLKIKELADADAAYTETIAQADKLFEEENWTEAKTSYQNALTIKPEESYPQTQIAAINLKIKELADADAAYAETIAQADKLFEEENWTEAKSSYQNALTIKPEESYPQAQIAAIDLKIKELADVDAAYAETIAQADKLFEEENWTEAKTFYQNALTIKPEESYPQTQIAAIELKIKELANGDAAYAESIAQADKLFKEENWTEAKTSYQNALTIKAEESYPQTQITAIDLKIKELANADAAYAETIAQADKLFEEENWTEAKSSYQNALTIKPEESYPQTQIAAIDLKIKELADVDAAYTETIAQADKLFEEENWTEAKSSYQNALTIKAEESYPQTQIAAIDLKIKELADVDAAYAETIAQADQYFYASQYDLAQEQYQEALKLKEANYPREQLNTINNIRQAEIQAKEDQYEQALADAEKLFLNKKYTSAIEYYKKALTIKPENAFAQNRISEIEQIMLEQNQKEQKYLDWIAEADQNFHDKQWSDALIHYDSALTIKPKEEYPTEQIAKLNDIIKELNNKEQEYQELISLGDRLFQQSSLDSSLSVFQSAGDLKPSENYPQEKIKEIRELLNQQQALKAKYQEYIRTADEAFAAEDYENARSSFTAALQIFEKEPYPAEQIKIIDALLETQKAYFRALQQADEAFGQEKWETSIGQYEQALEIKANQAYPLTQIDKAREELAKISQQQKAFAQQIQKADSLFAQSQWSDSKSAYQSALSLKADAEYPKNKIIEIGQIQEEIRKQEEAYRSNITEADRLFYEEQWAFSADRYEAAHRIKPEESYPTSQINKIRLKLEELEAQKKEEFDRLMQAVARLEASEQFEDALINCNSALNIYPENSEALNKKQFLEKRIQEIKASEALFNQYVAEGDEYFDAENWENAITSFQKALAIKPEHILTQQKLDLSKQKLEEELERQREAQYTLLINEADQHIKQQNYNQSLEKYKAALQLKPEEAYPKNKISWLENLLREMAEKEKAYSEAIKRADEQFDAEEYRDARIEYYNASIIKPDEHYPRERMNEIYQILAFDPAKIRQMFDDYIRSGDTSLKKGRYAEANFNYQNAAFLLPEEEYPYTQISQINKMLVQGKIKALGQENITIPKNSSIEFRLDDYKDFDDKSLFLVIKASNNERKSYDLIINYGRSGIVFGGTVVTLQNNSRINSYVINLGKQDYWTESGINWVRIYSEDNATSIQYLILSEEQ